MRRWLLLIIGLVTVLVVALPVAAVYYVAYTESGLRFLVEHMPRTIGSVRLGLGEVHGTLAGGMGIDLVTVEHERAYVRLEDVEGRLALLPLLWQTIHSPELAAGRVHVEIRPRTQPTPPSYTPRFLPRWLVIQADELHVGEATLVLPSGRELEGTGLEVSGVMRHRSIRLFEAAFDMDALGAYGNGELRAARPMQLDLDVRVTWRSPSQPDWIVAATAEGDFDRLDVNARFTEPLRADFSGQAFDLTGGWRWAGEARLHDLDLRVWGGGNALGRITGTLALEGDGLGFKAQGPLLASGLQVGEIDVLFDGAYASRTISARRIELRHRASGAVLTGTGSLGIVEGGPDLDLRGTWERFRWPLLGNEIAVRSSAGTYTLSGIWPYDLRAEGDFVIRDLAPMTARIEGGLARNGLTLRAADVRAFDGRAELTGTVSWSPQEQWAIAGRASAVDPAYLRADLPGRLDFTLSARGTGFGADSNLVVDFSDLGGRLRGVPMSGSGRIGLRSGNWSFENVRVGLGGTSFALDGRIGPRLDLQFGIDAHDLGLLMRESSGQLQASGKIRGTLADPAVQATASGSSIRYGTLAVQSFNATIDFDSREQSEARMDVRATGLTFARRTVESLTFLLDGTAASHSARLDARAGDLKLAARANGSFAAGKWEGQLDSLTLNGIESLHLELETPVALLLSPQRMRAEWLCLHGEPARLCADADWSPKGWVANFSATDLPMRTLVSGIDSPVDYRGTLNVTARAFSENDEPVQGSLRADLTDARIAHRLPSGRIEIITLGSGLVALNATLTGLYAEIGLDAGQIGTIKGTFNVARNVPDWRQMPLLGELRAETEELGLITLYVPEIDRAAGRLSVDLQLAGTLGTPLVDGTVQLTDGELDFYQVNLGLRETAFHAKLHDNGLDFAGSTRIGNGNARASGRIEWRDALPYGSFILQGTDLRIVDVPEARIDASPDLDFHVKGRRIEVTGAVRVPSARITPADLSGAVRASSDEIIVGDESEDPTRRFEVLSTITLTLGDQVSIATSGLTGRLSGAINVRSGYGDATHASGEFAVVEGRYAAYGRNLDIQRGRLIFTGGPIENPGVDIRAVKKFPDVVAGVNVRGTLQQPRLTFFSEPSLPQSQIISLILAGGSLASVQNSQNGGAGGELLAQGGAILAQQLGSRIGIEDVSLESNLSNETALVFGKYLSPRLYVSYGISLTESLNTLKLRYSLNDKWTIRTEFGEKRGADLVYTIEK